MKSKSKNVFLGGKSELLKKLKMRIMRAIKFEWIKNSDWFGGIDMLNYILCNDIINLMISIYINVWFITFELEPLFLLSHFQIINLIIKLNSYVYMYTSSRGYKISTPLKLNFISYIIRPLFYCLNKSSRIIQLKIIN